MKSLNLLLIISLTLISVSEAYSQDEDVIKLIEQALHCMTLENLIKLLRSIIKH